MLSYQHLYHAGNLADVHKHALLAWMLEYLTQKDKPLTYFESHAGRGLYDLTAPEAVKTGEAAKGIALAERWFPADHPYLKAIRQTRAERGPHAYPGSPLIAGHLLRPSDTIHLCELHPQEHAALSYAVAPFGAHVHMEDGLKKALSSAPNPTPGMLLIDPSYEIKTDYELLPKVIGQIARKWNVGIIALWYPILSGNPHTPMVRALTEAHPELFVHEVSFPPPVRGHRMTGSGMAILNPPFGVEEEAKRLTRLFRQA